MVATALPAVSARTETYDLIVRHGRVVDGTGNPAYFADVAVKNGRIAAVGRVSDKAKTEIDATGMIVAPGFIDVHTHADEVATLSAENFLRMGVTTVVGGNCGGSPVDIERAFHEIEQKQIAINFATLVGAGSIRSRGMGGSFNRPPTPEELDRMRDLVEQAMRAGAVGISTGLIYTPGVFSSTEEIIELARVVARHDGIYATHQRDEGTGIIRSLDEAIRIGREASVRVEISHIKLSGERAWGRASEVLAHLDKARAEGLDITQDQYAYTASSTGISQLIPDEFFDGGKQKFLDRLNDPAEKARIVQGMRRKLGNRGRTDYAYAVIASYRHDKSLNGLNIVEATQKVRGNASLDEQIEMILEIQRNGGASGVFHGMSEDDLQTFLRHPNTMVACDSGLRKFGEGVPHPRGYGNNARVLARYVRELKVLRLEDAIRKMTSLPATTFRLEARGLLRKDNWADLVVFDPKKVRDPSTFNDPHHYSEGFTHVLVNGVPVISQDQITRARPGMVLRHRSPARPATD